MHADIHHTHQQNSSTISRSCESGSLSSQRRYARYSQVDGLIRKIRNFKSDDKSVLASIREVYFGRPDGLIFRITKGECITERFDPVVSDDRIFAFIECPYHRDVMWKSRLDGLTRVSYKVNSRLECEIVNSNRLSASHSVTLSSTPTGFRIGDLFGTVIETRSTNQRVGNVISFNEETSQLLLNGIICSEADMRTHLPVIAAAKQSLTESFIMLSKRSIQVPLIRMSKPVFRKTLHDRSEEIVVAFPAPTGTIAGHPNEPKTNQSNDVIGVMMRGLDVHSTTELEEMRTKIAARQMNKGALIQQRLAEEQEQLKALRASGQRKTQKNDIEEFEALQTVALRRIEILEQRLARHEIESMHKLKDLDKRGRLLR